MILKILPFCHSQALCPIPQIVKAFLITLKIILNPTCLYFSSAFPSDRIVECVSITLLQEYRDIFSINLDAYANGAFYC